MFSPICSSPNKNIPYCFKNIHFFVTSSRYFICHHYFSFIMLERCHTNLHFVFIRKFSSSYLINYFNFFAKIESTEQTANRVIQYKCIVAILSKSLSLPFSTSITAIQLTIKSFLDYFFSGNFDLFPLLRNSC